MFAIVGEQQEPVNKLSDQEIKKINKILTGGGGSNKQGVIINNNKKNPSTCHRLVAINLVSSFGSTMKVELK